MGIHLTARTLLMLIALLTMAASCARSPQHLDLIALQGQPLSRAVADQQECETESPRGLTSSHPAEVAKSQAYAACLLARGYVSEVPLLPTSGVKRFLVYVRPDRPHPASNDVRSDITACHDAMQKTYADAPAGYKATRWLVSYSTGFGPYGGGVNIQRGELTKTFADCMSPRGYAVGGARNEVVPGR